MSLWYSGPVEMHIHTSIAVVALSLPLYLWLGVKIFGSRWALQDAIRASRYEHIPDSDYERGESMKLSLWLLLCGLLAAAEVWGVWRFFRL